MNRFLSARFLSRQECDSGESSFLEESCACFKPRREYLHTSRAVDSA